MPRRPARPPSTCDAPGCGQTIPRGRLMCRPHWYALPRHLREAITTAWKDRRIRDWSANCLEARRFLTAAPTRADCLAHAQAIARAQAMARAPVTPERAAQLRDRILGERTDR